MKEPGRRRDVLNQARRSVENALAAETPAAELAAAAEALLARGGAETAELAALRAAVARYRKIRPA